MTNERTPDRPAPNPWDREFVVDARSRDRKGGGALPRPGSDPGQPGDPDFGDAGPGTPFYGTVQPARRRQPHKVFLLAPWAGVAGLCCACFGAMGPWLLSSDWATAILVADCLAVALGIYATLGAWQGRGRMDFAAGALILGIAGLVLWYWAAHPAST